MEQGVSLQVQSEPDEVPAVSNEMGANILPQVGGQASATDGAMILDENTLRSLHEFIESQGLSASQNQNVVEGQNQSTPRATTLAEGIAQHYLPARTANRAETEEERRARQARVRAENRERKKKWRQQNSDRNKDNDLRCRVNKRALIMFGLHDSPEKREYIETEFRRRQEKRRNGNSPEASGSDNTDTYTALLNNPEFANILANLLAQKGLDAGDTSTQLVELLKSNPDYVRALVPAQMQSEELQDPTMVMSFETQLQQQQEALDLHAAHVESYEGPTPHQLHSIETLHNSVVDPVLAHTIPTALPIPLPEPEPVIEQIIEPPAPMIAPPPPPPQPAPAPVLTQLPTPASYPPIPVPGYKPKAKTPSQTQPPPSHERVRAFGFPPMMGNSR